MRKTNKKLPDTPEEFLILVGQFAQDSNLDLYAVGGYVRDKLLGLPFGGEIDISVVGDGPKFAKSLARYLDIRGEVQVYKRFGTARLQAGSITVEIATSRKESYREESRNPLVKPAPFLEDLARRDFTINALAINPLNQEKIIDHYDGQADLKKKLIRTPLDPITTFRDDPLRILRAVRFAVRLGFAIELSTWEAICNECDRLKIVARERINDEFFKILAVYPPSAGLNLLYDSGVLEVIFPEIAALAGVEQIGRHHHKDVFRHTVRVVDTLAKSTDRIDLLFAALVHDIGKPKTKRFDKDAGWTFHGHEHVGERIVKQFTKLYKLPEDLVQRTSRLVRLHMRPINLNDEDVTDSAIRRLVVQAGDQIDDLLLLCKADITSANKKKVARYLNDFDHMIQRMGEIDKKDELRSFQSPVRGDEIMRRTGLPESPRVGLIKIIIEEKILEGEIENTYESANSVFDKIAEYVSSLDDKSVLKKLRQYSQARLEGLRVIQE